MQTYANIRKTEKRKYMRDKERDRERQYTVKKQTYKQKIRNYEIRFEQKWTPNYDVCGLWQILANVMFLVYKQLLRPFDCVCHFYRVFCLLRKMLEMSKTKDLHRRERKRHSKEPITISCGTRRSCAMRAQSSHNKQSKCSTILGKARQQWTSLAKSSGKVTKFQFPPLFFFLFCFARVSLRARKREYLQASIHKELSIGSPNYSHATQHIRKEKARAFTSSKVKFESISSIANIFRADGKRKRMYVSLLVLLLLFPSSDARKSAWENNCPGRIIVVQIVPGSSRYTRRA